MKRAEKRLKIKIKNNLKNVRKTISYVCRIDSFANGFDRQQKNK